MDADDDAMARAGALKALRAWSGLAQADAATVAGLTTRTLQAAEAGGLCTAKTWRKMLDAYATLGLRWDAGPPECIVRRALPPCAGR